MKKILELELSLTKETPEYQKYQQPKRKLETSPPLASVWIPKGKLGKKPPQKIHMTLEEVE